ncbi:MAG: hypothetical protein ABIJ96_16140 [Elusimicrobiota bacterium]
MKRAPILAALLLSLPAAARAQNVVHTHVPVYNLRTSAAAGAAAAGSTLHSGLSVFSSGVISNTFKNMLQPPLATAYAATQSYYAQAVRGTKRVFTAGGSIFSYRPSKEVVQVAKTLNMPQSREQEHTGNLIGKPRRRSDFGAGDNEDFFVPNDLLDGGALKRELDGVPTSRAALESAAQRVKSLQHRVGSSDLDVLNENSFTFDGQHAAQ